MGTSRAFGFLLVAGLAAPAASSGHEWGRHGVGGSLVEVSVEVNGRGAPLYPAPDGSDRYYLEARKGCRYAVRLRNRTGERLGVVLDVDGLNAISGTRDTGQGRMYVLDPWREATIRGWRTSLQEVRRFTFVDEERSYATRSGQANARMGWIEVSVYRENRRVVRPHVREEWRDHRDHADEAEPSGQDAPGAPSSARPQEPAQAGEAESRAAGKGGRARSYPGTGWGPRAHDPVVLVSFEPESSASETVTLRYEYRRALVALGVLPVPRASHDRLWERERGEPGFAQPPLW